MSLPRLQRTVPITEEGGTPTTAFHIWWDRFAKNQEDRDTSQDTILTQIATLVNQVFSAISNMPDIADQHVSADYTGAVLAGQLPRTIFAQRFTDTIDNTLDATWSFTTDKNGITATFTADGELTVTGVTATTFVTIKSAYQGVDKTKSFTIYLDIGAPPPPSVSTVSDSSFNPFISTSFTPVSDELTVTVAASGIVTLTAPLEVTTGTVGSAGTFDIMAKWEWWDGVAWVDVAPPVHSDPDCSTTLGGPPSNLPGATTNGAIMVNMSKPGLTPAASEKFRLMASSVTGSRTLYLIGTATATS